MAEQQKLLNGLDPNIVKFLQSKRDIKPQTERKETEALKPAIGLQNRPLGEEIALETNSLKIENALDTSQGSEHDSNVERSNSVVLGQESGLPELFDKYPNMNRDEPEKREWMSEIPKVSNFHNLILSARC